MPVKMKFEDRDARINFEKQLKSHAGLRSVMSLPKPFRIEQSALQKALKDLYPNDYIMVRPDSRTLRLVSYQQGGWRGEVGAGYGGGGLEPRHHVAGLQGQGNLLLPPHLD
jgi:hypothetical protein